MHKGNIDMYFTTDERTLTQDQLSAMSNATIERVCSYNLKTLLPHYPEKYAAAKARIAQISAEGRKRGLPV